MYHDERFLNSWIRDHPFSLHYVTNLPPYVGINHFLQSGYFLVLQKCSGELRNGYIEICKEVV